MTVPEAGNLEHIAVIGMSARYPGAKNIDTFWKNLAAGKESISFFTDEELLKEGVEPELLATPNYVKARGVYEGTYRFDASFFGYNPREAELIDPQQRVLLECTWEALEHAGYDSDSFPGRIGLFGGEGPTSQLFEFLKTTFVKRSFGHLATITSNDKDYLATRIGYKLNLRGPCITVQTACSTSLVAIVVACQNLLNYQCDMALAGGVSLKLNDREGYLYDEGGITSPDGHNRTFDAAGQGTIFSQGAGMVVLKRMEDAVADHDTIHAVVRGFGLNNDGSARIGFTAPGMDGQIGVSSDAISIAGINPESIGFVECHGTATPMGDPIEITALTRSFQKYTQKKKFCAVGSVKSNIGHTDAAAGVAGFTKAVLALENKLIPASLHFEKPNPQIDFENSPFYVNSQAIDWKAGAEPRRAGINSFGVGGTNAHVILEEAPEGAASGQSRPHQLLVWSAKSSNAVGQMTERLSSHLENHPGENLADVAFTLQTGRRVLPHRRVLVCRDREDAVQALKTNAPGRLLSAIQEKQGRPLCFLFPGQGAQYAGMGKQLYETEIFFRAIVDQCADILKKHLSRDIRELLFPTEEHLAEANEQLDQTAFTQPALFIIEYSLARLLMAWGLKPEAMLGHSIGEYVAACLADVLSLEDALILVAARGRLMQDLPKGSMVGVLLPQKEVSHLLDEVSELLATASKLMSGNGDLSLAAVNSPSTCVVSGPEPAIGQLERVLETKSVPFRPLRTSHAFHSAMMDPILDRFRALLKKVELRAPKIPYISNLTGTWISASESMSPEYWVNHLRNTVRFADGAGELLKNPASLFIEVGPGRTLSTLVAQHPSRTPDRTVVSSLPHPKTDHLTDTEFLMGAVGRLWLNGAQVNWPEFYRNEDRKRIPLPTYPFQHEEYRMALPKGTEAANKEISRKKADITDWFYYPSWKRAPSLRAGEFPPDKCWILFLDGCGLGAEITERLRSQGQEVFTVKAADKFEQESPTSFTLTPGSHDHYKAFLKQLHAMEKTPGNVVHLWGIAPADSGNEIELCDATLERSFYSLMFLGQTLGTQFSTPPISLHIVSNDLYDVTGDGVLAPSRAALLGPCRTIPHEYGNIKTRSIDVHVPRNKTERAALVNTLMAEFTVQVDDGVVAYRGGHRWLQIFEPFQVQSPAEGSPGLRENGVYLITGGMGGIGLTIADHLARTVKAKLALVGRSTFPEKAQWSQWLSTHTGDNPISAKINKLREFESAGAEVLVFCADVVDLGGMQRVVDQVKERFGTIHGAIHTAGVAGDGIIELKTREVANKVLAPKIKGTLVLGEVLKNIKLDFLLLCSSVSSILGSIGQVDYTAANAFLDAYAYSKKGKNGTTQPIAINWDRWDEVGMAVNKMANASQGSAYRTNKPVPEPLEHPIFTAQWRDGMIQTYVTHLTTDAHWVVGEHLIQNSPTLVGTAYLELARAAFALQSSGPVELRDVVFMFPLMMSKDERREVHVVLKPAGAGFDFVISSSTDGNAWREHAMGKVSSATGKPKSREDNLSIMARCSRLIPVEFLKTKGGSQNPEQEFLKTSKRWNNMQAAAAGVAGKAATRTGSNELLATLHLSSEFVADLKTWVLHPALMDQATGFAIDAASQGIAYLPFSYKKIRINKALPPRLYSYSLLQSNAAGNDEFITFDLLLIDEQGESIVEIEAYDLRRIHGEVAGAPAKATATVVEAAGLGDALKTEVLKRDKLGDHILTREGTEVFRRIVAMNSMPQIVIASKDFSYLIEQSRPKDAQAASRENSGTLQQAPGAHPRPDLATPYVAPRNELEESIAAIWQSVLGIDRVGMNDGFVELGGHSLMAIQLIARVREMFETELSVAKLYNTPTVAGLTAAIVETLVAQADSEAIEQALTELESPALVASTNTAA